MERRLTEYTERSQDPNGVTGLISLQPISRPKRGRFPERYKLHQYWSRKPWYVVRRYIELFTKEGDTIIDPFVGSGVTACEALITRHKIIAIDINPVSTFITRVTCTSPVDLDEFMKAYERIESRIHDKVNGLYETSCEKCGSRAIIINTVWKNETPTICFYSCNSCGYKGLKPYDETDRKRVADLEKITPLWFPKDVMLPDDSDAHFLHELFTKRNLIALSMVHDAISKEEDSIIKDLLLIMLSSTIVRCSKLIFVNRYRLNRGVNPAGVWGEKRFWVPNEFVENNVFYYFKARLSKVVKAKSETNSLIGDYFTEKTCSILTKSSTNLSEIPQESIDYCFTDPPYGGSVQYMGLSTIWNAWLRLGSADNHEITINKHKTLQEYEEELQKVFHEIYRVLKTSHYLSVTFHSSNVDIWNSMLRACQEAGFELVNVVPQEPIKRSLSQIESKGTVATDLIVTFRKSSNGKLMLASREMPDLNELVNLAAKEYLKHRVTATTSEIYDAVVLKWIGFAYGSPNIPKKLNFSAKGLIQILRKQSFRSLEREQLDYKGCKRKLTIWRLPSSNA
jgi:DNA modification methylase